jgi:hypothetical protein
MKFFFLIGLGLMVLLMVTAGCSRRIAPSVTSEVSDSTYTKVVVREVPILIPGDTVKVIQQIECDPVTLKPKPFSMKKKSGRATVSTNLETTGILIVTSTCDSLQKIIDVKDTEITRLRKETVTTVKTEYRTRNIDIICRWIAGILVLLIAGRIAFKYFKPF